MDSYFDIKALPCAEIIQSAVVAHLIQALHQLLPQYGGEIGVDFPAYGQQQTVGGIVRLLGRHEHIHPLHQAVKTAATFNDYALITERSNIPENISGYTEYKRKHVKGNSHLKRLRKRSEANGTWTDALAIAAATKFSVSTNLPHVCLSSSSTGQSKFLLFIQKKSRANSHNGKFNGYGLSIYGTTVPKF